ncbi:MAG: hypothetical protein D3904_12310 [Candidatus Electrothrix sp. EH2]|nr:hypothetical protein [Candidatus Electrothrix sp. EH2]
MFQGIWRSLLFFSVTQDISRSPYRANRKHTTDLNLLDVGDAAFTCSLHSQDAMQQSKKIPRRSAELRQGFHSADSQ